MKAFFQDKIFHFNIAFLILIEDELMPENLSSQYNKYAVL